MSQITVIDPSIAGISGDMLLAGLIDAGADIAAVKSVLQLIPENFPRCNSITIETKTVSSHGFRACNVEFKISEQNHDTPISQLLNAAKNMAKESKLSKRAADFAMNAINLLIEVETKVHGTTPPDTHLHEAGSADTLADIFGVAAACDSLKLFDGEIISTPVAIGGGSVSFSHGTVSVPAPAVMEILRMHHIPMKGGPELVELTTPTGIAMLASLAQTITTTYPEMTPNKVGYGAGKKELTQSPNVLRIILGHKTSPVSKDKVVLLETNLDDVSGEILAHTMRHLMDAGAKDVWLTQAQFKKNRPGHVLHVLCEENETETFSKKIMEETGTLGVRYQRLDRIVLDRKFRTLNIQVHGKRFEVRVKVAYDTRGNIIRAKPEFEDIAHISEETSMPSRIVQQLVASEMERLGLKG